MGVCFVMIAVDVAAANFYNPALLKKNLDAGTSGIPSSEQNTTALVHIDSVEFPPTTGASLQLPFAWSWERKESSTWEGAPSPPQERI